MDEEQVDRIFDSLTQAEISTSREVTGTGLGLTIAKEMAEMLGGDLTVSSKPDQGSAFSVTIATDSLDGVPMLQFGKLSMAETAS